MTSFQYIRLNKFLFQRPENFKYISRYYTLFFLQKTGTRIPSLKKKLVIVSAGKVGIYCLELLSQMSC
jgi:hypothetical protein